MKQNKLIIAIALGTILLATATNAQTLQVTLSPDKSKVDRSVGNGIATIFFDSNIGDLSIVCTDENPNEPIIKINDNLRFIHIDAQKDIELDGSCYRNFLLRSTSSAEYLLTTEPILPNQVLYYTISLPNELEPELLKERAINISKMANQLVDNGDSYLARMLALSILPHNLQEPDKPYTIEAERALRSSTIHDNAILKGHEYYVDALDFNSGGNYIVSGGWDGQVKLWDVSTGQLVKNIARLPKHVTDVFFLSNDSSVVYSSADGTIQVKNIYSGKLETSFAADDPVYSCAIDVENKYIAGGLNQRIIIWDIKTHEQLWEIDAHKKTVQTLSFSPDGKQLVSSSADGTVKLWNCQTGKITSTIISNSSPRAARFSHNGKFIATASLGDGVQIWNTQTCKLEKQLSKGGFQDVCFSPNDVHIMSSSFDNQSSIKIWDVNSEKLVWDLQGHTKIARRAVFCRDGSRLASASDDKTIRLWDLSDHNVSVMRKHSDAIRSLSYSPDGNFLVSASDDHHIKVWSTTTGKCKYTLKGHNHWVMQATYTPNGKYIVSISIDKTIKIWDARNGKLLRSIENNSNGYMMEFSISPDGESIITKTDSSDTIKIWNINDGNLIKIIKSDNLRGAVCVSPNGKYILSNSPGVSLWEVRSGNKANVLTEDFVSNLTYSHNGDFIIGLSNNRIVIWNAETGEQTRRIDEVPEMLSFGLSPNDRYLIGVSEYDHMVRVWDLINGGIVYTLTQYKDAQNAVFSPDGQTLALSLKDNSIISCRFLPLQSLIEETAIRFKNRILTNEENEKYLNNGPN